MTPQKTSRTPNRITERSLARLAKSGRPATLPADVTSNPDYCQACGDALDRERYCPFCGDFQPTAE